MVHFRHGIKTSEAIDGLIEVRPALWVGLVLVSGIPRILGAFLLPNAFGDAYVYIETIGGMSARLSGGTFSLKDLFGFWLPMYQFICAVINVPVGHPFYVAKLVSAICGTGICLLVFSISFRLTAHRTLALLSFTLIACNPLHILHSASAMTDVPHAFFVMSSLYFALEKRWVPAAGFAAIAGLMRVESWMLFVLLPLLQFLDRRRISHAALVILAIPPMLWLYICWRATGNAFAYFEVRSQYTEGLKASNPLLASFSLSRVLIDAGTLLGSTDPAVMVGCLVGGWLVIRRQARSIPERITENPRDIVAACLYFFAFLGFILLAYVSGNQPEMWLRYGLILFALGIPILSWTFLELRRRRPRQAGKLSMLIIAVCFFQASIQLAGTVGFVNRVSTQRLIADYLRVKYQADPRVRIFCDDGTVKALSGIPFENFPAASDAPPDGELFLASLKEKKVEYVVYMDGGSSTPTKLFPEPKDAADHDLLRPVMHASSKFFHTEIWLYQFQSEREPVEIRDAITQTLRADRPGSMTLPIHATKVK